MTLLLRKLEEREIPALLALYRHLHPNDPVLEPNAAHEAGSALLRDPNLQLIGAFDGDRLVSTCTLVIIPNLTRGARPYGLIENVVTHPEYRRRGIGTEVLHHALRLAWERNAYKVMLLTSRKDEATLRFYEQAGFLAGVKTGFIARPPEVEG